MNEAQQAIRPGGEHHCIDEDAVFNVKDGEFFGLKAIGEVTFSSSQAP